MATVFNQLLTIQSHDPETERRGRVVIIISLGMLILALAFVPLTLLVDNFVSFSALIFGGLFFCAAIVAARRGIVNLGAWMLIGATLGAIGLAMLLGNPSPTTPFYLILPLLMASVMLPPGQIWSILVVTLLCDALLFSRISESMRNEIVWRQSMQGAPLLLISVAMLGFVSARSIKIALNSANSARAEAEQTREQLAAANLDLEERVVARTRDLERTVAEQRHTAAELAASLQNQRNLNQLINELSVPIIPVSHNALVVPLVGGIDSARAEQLMSDILTRVENKDARMVILDVTGVAVVDTLVASALLRVADAIKLMGAQAMICGIRPEVAQTLVQLGADLSGIRTGATLQDSLAQVL
ncbi:MAG: STAS domain-containing protein [Oscillochloris sp.]|nr:STAS domain-containing protein [Oscillochloris sp.]